MPPRKSQIRITVEANGERFSISGEWMLNGRYRVKRGRSISRKMPDATLTEIFNEARKWSVHRMEGFDYLNQSSP